ncbi:hypothetical protein B0J11DRAFT_179519 [Dendryphion nanum]|uniref:Uncharacterized protein n=1 Tax=Dendryphion nanum TaxID=256645 RepID=A0A9P9IZ18_9PLEO|nr:hypothetical protein B0J11DRAFT_179519 [Dendryphion nanum]
MSCDSCIYTCSTRGATSPPPQPCPNADVSGIGVVTGYTVNAGIVVVIILLNYIFAFEPDADPFLLEERGAQPRAEFLPNPIDKLVVAFIREKCRIHVIVSKSVKEALKKCVLSMSDLQILTGISILISGFKQLRCGISNYHWSILVYLAWFSSLTHFGCLTFLRNYLFNHPGERAWRLFFMAVIVVMLMVALYPTGQADDFWNPSDAVICLYKHSRSENSDPTPFINMIISMILLGFGFFIRIVKLFQILSTSASNKIRNPFSKVECWALSRVYNWSSIHQHPTGWKRLLVYRPLLAWALLFRIGIDLYLSMLGEVLWMAISFAWGLVHLLRVRRSAHGGENDWSFGQVVPVILIAAPLLTVFEFFYPGMLARSVNNRVPRC